MVKESQMKTSEPGWVNFNFNTELQALINEKNIKYNRYIKKCDKCWLVVIVDRSQRDEVFDFERDMQGEVFRSSFDSVYFFDIRQRKIYKLKIQ